VASASVRGTQWQEEDAMQFEVKKNGDATILKIKERKLDASVSPELKEIGRAHV
jgi:hypothetical protein